jgi:hypothetical protein
MGKKKLFANYTSDKGLITRIYKELKNSTSHRINNLLNIWTNELNRQFSKREALMVSKYMKKYSTSLAIKEMLVITTLRFYLTPVKMAIINVTNNHKCWWRCEQKGSLLFCWWEYKLVQLLCKAMWISLKK